MSTGRREQRWAWMQNYVGTGRESSKEEWLMSAVTNTEKSMLKWNQNFRAVVLDRIWDSRMSCLWAPLWVEFCFIDHGDTVVSGAEHFPLPGTDNLKAESLPIFSAALQLSDGGKSSVSQVRVFDLCCFKTFAASEPPEISYNNTEIKITKPKSWGLDKTEMREFIFLPTVFVSAITANMLNSIHLFQALGRSAKPF